MAIGCEICGCIGNKSCGKQGIENINDCSLNQNLVCPCCQDEMDLDSFNIVNIMLVYGCSYHCATRQVWGDGECQCDLEKSGYDPEAWMELG